MLAFTLADSHQMQYPQRRLPYRCVYIHICYTGMGVHQDDSAELFLKPLKKLTMEQVSTPINRGVAMGWGVGGGEGI